MAKISDYDVFISYRREGGDVLACLLKRRLEDLGFRVFYDVESLRSGKFNKRIPKVIESCKDVLVVLPKGGLDRCSSRKDWVRREIRCAIEGKKNVVPIMMKGFKMPKKKTLSRDIRALADFNGVNVDMEYFDASFEKILSMLTRTESTVPNLGEYTLIYSSFSPFSKRKFITADLLFDQYSRVSLSVNNSEYTYQGTAVSMGENLRVDLKNDESEEELVLYLRKPAGNLDRYLGLLLGLSSNMVPVCFKCACLRPELIPKINEDSLEEILSNNNREWSGNLLILESIQMNLFYSDYIFNKSNGK